MSERTRLVIHERRGNWARQLRPRAANWDIRLVETRSTDDLKSAIHDRSHALLVIDLGDRPAAKLDDLGIAMTLAPTTLALVLDPENREGVGSLARELGATLVLSGIITPPVVVNLLQRWRSIADSRAGRDGWLEDELDAADPHAELLKGIISTRP